MRMGSLPLEKPLALAPMEDVTDTAFRLICRKLGADIVYTEFTSSEALVRDAPKALRKIQVTDAERPIGIQIFGGLETSMERAAQVAESFQPDFIDINCGCWVKDVALAGQGAGLLRDLPRLESIVRSTVRATKLPVTVKTRLGWDEKNIVIEDVAKIVEQSGAQALAIHCRTRSQGHRGLADWGWLERVKRVVSIPIIGNGDVTTVHDVKRMFETGCDAVMIGRGALINPWLFQQAKYFLKTGSLLSEPTLQERMELCLEHLKLAVEHKGLREGVITFRKYYAGYLRGLPNVAQLRSELMQLLDVESVMARLNHFLSENSKLIST